MEQFSQFARKHLEKIVECDLSQRVVYDIVKDGNIIIESLEKWEIAALNPGEKIVKRLIIGGVARLPNYSEWTII